MNNIWLRDDFYWDMCRENRLIFSQSVVHWDTWANKDNASVGTLSDWESYLLMMENVNGLKYVDSIVELSDIDDSDIFKVVDERKAQLFLLKHARYISGN